MRSLYWKIFLSFWLATILVIFTTAWITSQIVQKSSQPVRERAFMDSYANAAVVTFESAKAPALLKWLHDIGLSRHMTLYLLSNTGEILGTQSTPSNVKDIATKMSTNQLNAGIFSSGNLLVSHEILSTSGNYYRLVAVSGKPISYFVQIPWAGLMLRLTFAVFISGLICYLLSLYLTKPLRFLGMAAQSLATGKLNTRVGRMRGHKHDEIAHLSNEFDRMAEQLETIVNSKERLLQDISHELRSPLARLQIALELGRNKTQTLAEAEFSRMELECARLNFLICEILEFARLEKSTTELNLEETNLAGLLAEAIDDANFESGEHLPKVQAGLMEDFNLMIDARLVHRAVDNILRNALRYSPEEKSITVSLTFNSQKNQAIIGIQDRGPGVPSDQLEKIFTPFYRVDPSREKKTGGYGLGLAIAARAVKLHHGEIRASNCQEGGLLVQIILPL